jgi:hypothetical protein
MPALYADLNIGGFSVQPTNVLLKQADFAHEVAACIVPAERLPYGGREENLPVQLQWGRFPGNKATFSGYVHHTEPNYGAVDAAKTVRLVCLGATTALSKPLQAVWHNRSVDAVVQELAEGVYLSALAEQHSQIWDTLVASGGTAWEFMTQLAGKVGYRLASFGTEVRFLSLTTLFKVYGPQAPTVVLGAALDHFQADVGNLSDGVSVKRSAVGIDQRSGQLFNVTDTGTAPQFGTEQPGSAFSQLVDTVLDSPDVGAAKLAGLAAGNSFTYTAAAELRRGDTLISNGSFVYVDGVEPSQAGHWYVIEAEHDLDVVQQQFNSYLQLGRDALGAWGQNPITGFVTTPLRQTPLGDSVATVPPSVLVGNRWRSGWARRAS